MDHTIDTPIRDIQNKMLEILVYFRDFCRDNGLRFALCGGTALVLFRSIARRDSSRLLRCLKGGAMITGCELLCGLAFNRDKQVWDYSALPGNLGGQICPQFSALWTALCLPLSGLCPVLERHLDLLDKR